MLLSMKKTCRRLSNLNFFGVLIIFITLCITSGCASQCKSGTKKTSAESGIVNEDVDAIMSEFMSEYVPFQSEILPQIRITSNSGSKDFITKPVDRDVSAQKKNWGGYKGEPAPWYEACTITVIDEYSKKTIDDVDAQVRVRGNWTSNYPKKGIRIKFDKKQSMLGLNNNVKMKNWILLASYKDWSFLRDQTALYLSNLISPYYTSDFRLVELYVNEEFYGIYIVAEQQEVAKQRINITEPKKGYEGNDIGYIIELDDHTHQDENHFTMDFGKGLKDINGKMVKKFIPMYSVKSDINSESQLKFIDSYMNNLWKICYEAVYKGQYYKFNDDRTALVSSDAKTCYECVSSVIDIESLVNTYILHEIVCDADFYYTSFYMDVDLGPDGNKLLTFEAPWDFDSSLGNKNFCVDSQGLFASVIQWDVNHYKKEVGNPWFLIFINCNWFQDLVRQKWSQISEQGIIYKLSDHIEFVSTKYTKYFEKDQGIWGNIGHKETIGELCTAAGSCKNEQQAAFYLQYWLEERFKALDELWLEK